MVGNEARPNWRRSKHCESGSCVEIQAQLGLVMVRDGDNPVGPPLALNPASWRSFTERAKRRAFDPGSVRSGPG
jgi:hypothetical protein